MSKKKTPAKKPTPPAKKPAKRKPAPAAKKTPDQIKIDRLLRRIGDLETMLASRAEQVVRLSATIESHQKNLRRYEEEREIINLETGRLLEENQKLKTQARHDQRDIAVLKMELSQAKTCLAESRETLEQSRRQVAEWKETIPPKMQELRGEIAEHIDTIAEQNGTIEKQSEQIAELRKANRGLYANLETVETAAREQVDGLVDTIKRFRKEIGDLETRNQTLRMQIDQQPFLRQPGGLSVTELINQQRRQIRQLNAAHQSDVKRRAELQRALESCQKQLRETQIKANQLEVNSGLRADYCTVKAQLAAVLEREAAAKSRHAIESTNSEESIRLLTNRQEELNSENRELRERIEQLSDRILRLEPREQSDAYGPAAYVENLNEIAELNRKLQLSDKILTDVAECIEFIRQAPIGQISLMKDYGPLTLAGKIQREFDRRARSWQIKVDIGG